MDQETYLWILTGLLLSIKQQFVGEIAQDRSISISSGFQAQTFILPGGIFLNGRLHHVDDGGATRGWLSISGNNFCWLDVGSYYWFSISGVNASTSLIIILSD